MNLGDIRTFARTQILQTDSVDVPDSLLDAFARDAVNRVISKANNWPHLEALFPFTTVSGTHNYTIVTIAPTLNNITGVVDEAHSGWYLDEIDYQTAKGVWVGSADYSAEPYAYSIYGGQLYIWPKPNDARSLSIVGQRLNTTLTAVGDLPDLPTYFHEAIAYFVTSMAYGQQEDTAVAAFWKQMYDESVDVSLERTFKASNHRPIILNGQRPMRFRTYEGWMNGMARG